MTALLAFPFPGSCLPWKMARAKTRFSGHGSRSPLEPCETTLPSVKDVATSNSRWACLCLYCKKTVTKQPAIKKKREKNNNFALPFGQCLVSAEGDFVSFLISLVVVVVVLWFGVLVLVVYPPKPFAE